MRRYFLHGMEGAGNNVKGKPGQQQPTGPIVAKQEKGAAEHGKKSNGRDENDVGFERLVREVISKTYAARQNEQDAEDGDWPGSLHTGRRDSTRERDRSPSKMDEFRCSKAKFSREWRSRELVPTTDRFVRADGDEPRPVGRIGELRDSAAVRDVMP